ncbi:peptide ABC transporter substrate-binding protein [Microvirga pudoricolor]|uniref:peptide ABC transporter substrate-binding protein n=1 Tax=Microvirga pudoricolor TaxID=2778729 RepID=UPI00194DD4A6|nr:peptide ABC transporter substrate-binding protein [Microvirga pudoricolor]MBM6594505.1 peptide ABC transporter substrate-binding protein [Microvirga pudoricolor]
MSSWLKRTALMSVATIALMGAAQAEVVYNRANSGEPETLDTHKTSTVQESHILRDLLEGLVTYNAKGEAVPGQATKWEISDDGKTYRFTLRDGIKWSNGDPVKASDFVFSYRRIIDPATGAKYANILYPIKGAEAANKGQGKLDDLGVKAIDDKTLEITLEQPTPYFVELLTHQTSLPVHPGSVEKFGKDFVKPGNMVSNGAYKLAEFTPNSHIKLAKNDQYYDAKNVQIDTVMYYPTSDFAAMVRRYEAGELDTTDDLPADQMKSIKQKFKDQVHLGPWLGTWYLVVNSSKAPFSDVKVRQALAMGVDREFIAEQIWGETMQPGYSFMPPGLGNAGEPAYADFKETSPIDREEKAKALLKEAGFGPGKPLKVEIRYNTTDNNRNTVVAVAEQWKNIGVETSFINTDGKTHFAHLRDGGDFDVARYGWIADYSDPNGFLFLLKSDNKGFNYGKYNNPEFDKLLDDGAKEMDLKKRADIMQKAEAILAKDMPWIPIMYYGKSHLISPKIKGFEHNTRGVYPTRFLSKTQ